MPGEFVTFPCAPRIPPAHRRSRIAGRRHGDERWARHRSMPEVTTPSPTRSQHALALRDRRTRYESRSPTWRKSIADRLLMLACCPG